MNVLNRDKVTLSLYCCIYVYIYICIYMTDVSTCKEVILRYCRPSNKSFNAKQTNRGRWDGGWRGYGEKASDREGLITDWRGNGEKAREQNGWTERERERERVVRPSEGMRDIEKKIAQRMKTCQFHSHHVV